MFKPDQPIQHIEEDVLGRRAFAQALGDAILQYQEKDSLVIGLFGAWGSGKTSVVNMTLEHINAVCGERPKDEKSIIIPFNPWNYSDQNQLLTQFFQTLSTAIGRPEYGKDAKEAGKKLERLAKLFGPLKLIPEIGQLVGIFQEILKTTSEAAKSYADSKANDLYSIKTELNKLLDKLPCKIIIVIDDIDRLNNTEIRQIFQLIKSLGDFHNTIYLLAFDKSVVINALNDVQEKGLEYLEKVVQAPFEIPLVSKQAIDRLLFKRVDELAQGAPEDRWDQVYWGNLYYSGLHCFFNTIRDVTRYINSLRFSFNLVKDEVNAADFLAITTFQVFAPEVYHGIRDNKHLFSGIFDSRSEGTKEQAQERCNEIIGRIDKLPQESLKDVLTRMFPKLQTIYGNIGGHSYDFLRSWRRQGQICSPEVFDIFFRLSLPEGDISQKEMETLLSLADNPAAFSEALSNLNKDGRIAKFLDHFRDYIDDIPEDHLEPIITVFMNIGDAFPEPEDGFSSTFPFFYDLLYRIDCQEERFDIFKRVIEEATRSLWPVVYEVGLETSRHGKYKPDKPWPEERLLVSAEQLEELEQLACQKIESWAVDGRLSKHPRLSFILFRWKRWGNPEHIAEFVNSMIADDEGLVDFISSFLSPEKTYSSSDYVYRLSWRLPLEEIEEFVNVEQIEPRIRAIATSSKFNQWDDKKKSGVDKFLDAIDKK